MAEGGRKPSKNIRLFKVEVSSAKLLAMVEMVEWIGAWKITKWNNNVLILKITPGPTPTFWKEKKKAVKYGLKNRICNFAYFHGAWDWRSYYSWIQPPSGWHVYIIKEPVPHCGVTGQMGETSDWPKWRGAHSYWNHGVDLVQHDVWENVIILCNHKVKSSLYPAYRKKSHILHKKKQVKVKHEYFISQCPSIYSVSCTVKTHEIYKVTWGLQTRKKINTMVCWVRNWG